MSDQLQTPAQDSPTLRYRVPEEQDPVVVLTALARADYRAVPEPEQGRFYVSIDCPNGRDVDRERIRAAIARGADETSLEGPRFERPVVFDDET